MKTQDIHKVAQSYYAAHGDKAEVEAAQKAVTAEAAGDTAESENWHAIRAAIKEMRGAHQG